MRSVRLAGSDPAPDFPNALPAVLFQRCWLFVGAAPVTDRFHRDVRAADLRVRVSIHAAA